MISPTFPAPEAEPLKSKPSKAISDSQIVITDFLKGENPGQNVVVKWNRETKEKSLIFKRTNFLFRKTETENLKTIRDYCQAHEELLAFTPNGQEKTLEDLLIKKGLLEKKETVKRLSEHAIEDYKGSKDPKIGLVVKVDRQTRMPYLKAKELNVLERWQRGSSRSKGAASIWAVRKLCETQKIPAPRGYVDPAKAADARVPTATLASQVVESAKETGKEKSAPTRHSQNQKIEPKKDILKALNAVSTDKEVVSLIQQAQSQDIVLLLCRVQENDAFLPAILEGLVKKGFDQETIIDLISKIDPKAIPDIQKNTNITEHLSPRAVQMLSLRLEASKTTAQREPEVQKRVSVVASSHLMTPLDAPQQAKSPPPEPVAPKQEEETKKDIGVILSELGAYNITDEDVVSLIHQTQLQHIVLLLEHPSVVSFLEHSKRPGSAEVLDAIKERLSEVEEEAVPAILESIAPKRFDPEVISDLIRKLDKTAIPQILTKPKITEYLHPEHMTELILRLDPKMVPKVLEDKNAKFSQEALFHLAGSALPQDVPRILANPYLTEELLVHNETSILIRKLFPEDHAPEVPAIDHLPAILAILKNPNSSNLVKGEIEELISKVPKEQLQSCIDDAIANIKKEDLSEKPQPHIRAMILAWAGEPPNTHHILQIIKGEKEDQSKTNYVKFLPEKDEKDEKTLVKLMSHLSPSELEEVLPLETIPEPFQDCENLSELFERILEERNLILFSSLMQKLDEATINKMWQRDLNAEAVSLLIKFFAQEMMDTNDAKAFGALIAKIPPTERQEIFNELYPKFITPATKSKMLQAWESINVRPESS